MITNFTAEEDNREKNEEMVASCVTSNTEVTASQSTHQSVSTPKPCSTSSSSSPLAIIRTTTGPTKSEDGKQVFKPGTIYLIKTSSPNILVPAGGSITNGQLKLIKQAINKNVTSGQIVVKGQARVKMASPHKSAVNIIRKNGQVKFINAGQVIGSSTNVTSANQQSLKNKVSTTAGGCDPTKQQTVYKCPVTGCGKYNLEEGFIKRHMSDVHRIECPSPLKQVIGEKQMSSFMTQKLKTQAMKEFDATPSTSSHKIETVSTCNTLQLETMGGKGIVSQLFKCGKSECSRLFLTEFSVWHHMEKDHGITEEESASYTITKLAPESCPKSMFSEEEYVEAKKREHFIPNTSFSLGKAIVAQAREMVINLKLYFELEHREWNKARVMREIAKATKLSWKAVQRIVLSFEKHKKIIGPKEQKKRAPHFVCSDEDREVILQCMYKLKDESRLTSVQELYCELMKSDQFNPSFKGCSSSIFYRLFAKTGLKISERLIINRKPELMAKEKTYGISPLKSSSGQWECDWPGCMKTFKLRENMIEHIRCHTDDKPYECIFPKCRYKCRNMSNIKHHQRSHKSS